MKNPMREPLRPLMPEVICEVFEEVGQSLIGLPAHSPQLTTFKKKVREAASRGGYEQPLITIGHKRLITLVTVRPLSQRAPMRQIARAWADAEEAS